jgi:hypothetical protein
MKIVRDLNYAKNLYDMGMKVAAVATLCQDERVFVAMINAGTPCPINGKIGAEAKPTGTKEICLLLMQTKNWALLVFIEHQLIFVKNQKKLLTNSNQSSCNGYTGNDPIVRSRMGC